METGSLRITVDDREFRARSQMADTLAATQTRLAHELEAELDEVFVFHRALSAEELAVIRRHGLDAQPTKSGK